MTFPLVLVVATCAIGAATASSILPTLDALEHKADRLDLLRFVSDERAGAPSSMTATRALDAALPDEVSVVPPPAPQPTRMHAQLAAFDAYDQPPLAHFPLLPDGSMLLAADDGTAGGRADAFLFDHAALPAAPTTAAAPPLGARHASLAADAPSAPSAAASGPPSSGAAQRGTGASAASATTARPFVPTFSRAAQIAAGTGAALGVLALLGFALYHRIRPTTTLENDTRKHIFEAVCATPGLGVHAIAQHAGVSYSTATYHLERLVAAGMIVMTPDGNKLCYYKNGGAFTETERRILPILKNDEAAKLLEAILENPGTYRAALAERLGVTATTINWHLRRLREANLVNETRQGRNAYLYANTLAMQQALPGLAQKLSASDVAVAERIRRYVGYGAGGVSASS